jgi:anti-sigma factor RsiW
MQHEHPLDSIPAYVLGALDADEALRVRTHLATCASCRAEVESFQQIVGMLPYASPGVLPPQHVKRQLFARVAAAEEPREAPPHPGQLRMVAAPRHPPFARLAAAAAFALALGLGWTTFESRQQLARIEQQFAETERTITALETQVRDRDTAVAALETQVREGDASVAALETQVREQEAAVGALETQARVDAQIVAFISSPQTVSRTVAPTARAGDARAQMYMQPGHNQVVLVVHGLPPAPAGSVYQLWLADEREQVAVGTLGDSDSNQGATRLIGTAPRPMDTYAEVMVTLEMSGGGQSPSDTVVFETQL